MDKAPLSIVLKVTLDKIIEERCRLNHVIPYSEVTREMFDAYKVGFKEGLEKLLHDGEFDPIFNSSNIYNDLGKNYIRYIISIVDDKLEDLYRRRLKYIQ